jgi:hypothetical protein
VPLQKMEGTAMEELYGSPGGPVERRVSVRRLLVLAVCVLLTVFGIPQSAMAATPAAVGVVAPAAAPQVAAASVPQVGGAVPAVTAYPSGFGKFDILLDSVETERVAKSIWGGAVVCWPMAAGGLLNAAGAVGAYGTCIALVTVCAARAYLSSPRARAGMTVTVWGYGWCWKY